MIKKVRAFWTFVFFASIVIFIVYYWKKKNEPRPAPEPDTEIQDTIGS